MKYRVEFHIMEREYKCKYLGGKYISSIEGIPIIYPFYVCEAPEDSNPSQARRGSFDDGETKDFCRGVAIGNQIDCSGYKPSEEVTLIRL